MSSSSHTVTTLAPSSNPRYPPSSADWKQNNQMSLWWKWNMLVHFTIFQCKHFSTNNLFVGEHKPYIYRRTHYSSLSKQTLTEEFQNTIWWFLCCCLIFYLSVIYVQLKKVWPEIILKESNKHLNLNKNYQIFFTNFTWYGVCINKLIDSHLIVSKPFTVQFNTFNRDYLTCKWHWKAIEWFFYPLICLPSSLF